MSSTQECLCYALHTTVLSGLIFPNSKCRFLCSHSCWGNLLLFIIWSKFAYMLLLCKTNPGRNQTSGNISIIFETWQKNFPPLQSCMICIKIPNNHITSIEQLLTTTLILLLPVKLNEPYSNIFTHTTQHNILPAKVQHFIQFQQVYNYGNFDVHVYL